MTFIHFVTGKSSGILSDIFFWHSIWHSIWHAIWRSIWHIFWHSIWSLRSSGAHWARKVPDWSPAVPTALRTLQLRSSLAHSDRKPAVEVQRCPLRAEVGEEIGDELARPKPAVEVQCPLRAEVGEEIGDKLARRKWTWKLMQTWSRRNWRRRKRRRRRRRRMRRTALIKSNNPHLAGGEQLHPHRMVPPR